MLKINFMPVNRAITVFNGQKKNNVHHDQISFFDTKPDVFKQTPKKLSPKEQMIKDGNVYLKNNGYFLLKKTSSKIQIQRKSNLLKLIADNKLTLKPYIENNRIITDTILTELLKKLKDDDPFKKEVFFTICKRKVTKGESPKSAKEYYTRMGILYKPLLNEIVKDQNNIAQKAKENDIEWLDYKYSQVIQFEKFIEKNEYHSKYDLQKINKKLNSFKGEFLEYYS